MNTLVPNRNPNPKRGHWDDLSHPTYRTKEYRS
jgi:hypothetical protein